MRKYAIAIILLLAFTFGYSQKKQSVESKIKKVTVFVEGAQVERSASVQLSPGKNELIFRNISPEIDKQSIQVTTDGNAVVLSVIHQQNFIKEQQKQEEIIQLENQKEIILSKIISEKKMIEVYKQEENMLIKNQEIGGNNGIKTADLKEAADFQRQRLTEIYQKLQDIEKSIKKSETEINKITRQLVELNKLQDYSTSEIIVNVQSKQNYTGSFSLTYLVKKAGWFPSYDIRVKDISSPVDLFYKANIQQQSGEDWKDIKMFLSTGNPNENGEKPLLNPWLLSYQTYTQPPLFKDDAIRKLTASNSISGTIKDKAGHPIPGVSIVLKGTAKATATDQFGNFKIETTDQSNILVASSVGFDSREFTAYRGTILAVALSENQSALEEVVVVGYGTSSSDSYTNYYESNKNYKRKQDKSAIETVTSYQPTTVVYEIKDPYTVLNDGKTYTADIDAYEINAIYEYYASPKLEESVYLTAKITDWQELNLQPGEINLFFEGTYLGQSFLDILNENDTMNISLGKDKGVVVQRKLIKELSSKKFIGSNKTDSRNYEIAVRNNKQQPINIVIEDQLPISTQKEIDIRNKKYDDGKLDEDSQKITWSVSLESKKEKKIGLSYEIRYPKDKLVNTD